MRKYVTYLPFDNKKCTVTWKNIRPYFPEMFDMHGNVLHKNNESWLQAFKKANKNMGIKILVEQSNN